MPRKLFTLDQESEIVRLYESGETGPQIADRFGCHFDTIYTTLVRHGVAVKDRRSFSDEQTAAIIRRYQDGESALTLANEFGVSWARIYNVLKTGGIATKSPTRGVVQQLNAHAFDELTPDALYWLGFLFADGTITETRSTKQVALVLAERDREHLEKFRAFLGSTHTITHYTPSHFGDMPGSTPKVRIAIASKHLVGRLLELGLVNSKTENRVPPSEARDSPDFWRGVIDGDGSVMFRDSDGFFCLNLCGNLPLLRSWMAYVRSCAPECKATPRRSHSIFSCHVTGYVAHIMVAELYGNDRVALDRKKAKADKILALERPQVKVYRRRKPIQMHLI